jgi:hypothetical protein
MPLLNYSTTVSSGRSVAAIHELLTKAGARQVVTLYDTMANPVGIGCLIVTPLGERYFRLPVEPDNVLAVLRRQRMQPRYKTPEHAHRVAWRIAKDWLEAQLALIESEMVTLDCVMLPYMQGDDGRTVYDLYVDRSLPELGAG